MDMGISYNTTLLKVNRTIEMLRSCGMDVTEFESVRDGINEEVKGKVKASYDYNDPKIFAGSGQEAFLVQDYSAALSKLNKLSGTLQKYEIYIKAYSFTKLVKDFLVKKDKTEEEFNKYRNMLIKILNELNHSSTLDYQVEEPIIKEIYHAVYLFIKEEFAILGRSETIGYLSENEYIDHEVRRELEELDLREEKYNLLSIRKNEIDSSGFNASYVDYELIKLLVGESIPPEKKDIALRDLEIKMDDYISKLIDLDNAVVYNKRNYKYKPKRLVKNLSWLLLNSTVIISAIIGPRILSKKLMEDKAKRDGNIKYLTTSRIYSDDSEEVTVTSKYMKNVNETTSIYEYYPSVGWVSYDLGSIKAEDYMDLDIASSNLRGEIVKKGTREYDLVSKYNEAVRIIEEIDIDSEDYIYDTATKTKFLSWILTGCIWIIVLPLIFAVYYNADRYWHNKPFILEVENIWKEIENLAKGKKNKKELKELTKEMIKLIKDNIDTVKQIGALIRELENNPEFNEKVTKLKRQLETEEEIIKKRKLGR